MDGQFRPPFDLAAILLQGLWQGVQMAASFLWSLPAWALGLLRLLVIVRLRWPWLLAEERVVPRRRSRRRRRHWDD